MGACPGMHDQHVISCRRRTRDSREREIELLALNVHGRWQLVRALALEGSKRG